MACYSVLGVNAVGIGTVSAWKKGWLCQGCTKNACPWHCHISVLCEYCKMILRMETAKKMQYLYL